MKTFLLLILLTIAITIMDVFSKEDSHIYAGEIPLRPLTCEIFSSFNITNNRVKLKQNTFRVKANTDAHQSAIKIKTDSRNEMNVFQDKSKYGLNVHIVSESELNTLFKVYSYNGSEIFSCNIRLEKGINHMKIETQSFTHGIYFAVVKIGFGTLFSKFIIM